MKNLILAACVSMGLVFSVYAAEDAQPKTKKVCLDVQGKDGKPVIDPKTKKPKQDCKTVKVHKKHEGTKLDGATKDKK